MRKILFTVIVSLFVIATQLLADATKPLNFTAVNGPATIRLNRYSWDLDIPSIDLEYSSYSNFGGSSYSLGQTISLSEGETVYFWSKNTSNTFSGDVNYYYFSMTGTVSADGNIMSLLDQSLEKMKIEHTHCFMHLFENCTSLIKAPELPATELASSCYSSMFEGCTSLTEAPELPATKVASCCYSSMFKDCSALVKAPTTLTAERLEASSCHSMFKGCISLVRPPKLPASNFASNCYKQMFDSCISLISLPILPATYLTTGCYYRMFYNCSSLVVNNEAPGTQWQISGSATPHDDWNTSMFYGTGGTQQLGPEPGVVYYIASDTTTAVEQVSEDIDITLFPNPIHIGEPAYINTTDDIQSVEIYNPDGKCIQHLTPTSSPIRIDNLNAAGIYIIRLTTKNNTSTTRKLIVQ